MDASIDDLLSDKRVRIAIEREACSRDFTWFVREAWKIVEPGAELKWNWHMDVLCAYITAYHERRIKRLILNVPPGTMKSLLVSVMAPAWAWTRWPERRYINLTNEKELASRDSLRMRDIVQSDWYQERWGDKVKLSTVQSQKTNFANTKRGFRIGLGITSNITGKRGTDLIIDDPIDAKKAFSEVEINEVNNTYDSAVSSRLNDLDNDGIMLIMQRVKTNDLTGHLLKKKLQDWVIVRIPMRYEGSQDWNPIKDLGIEDSKLYDPRKKKGELLFPERFSEKAVRALEEDLGSYGTAGQLQQRPSPLGGGIIKKHWWRMWPDDKPLPPAVHVFSSLDTAYTEKDYKEAAMTARTTWMVFEDDSREMGRNFAMILIAAWWERVGYPDLRRLTSEHVRERAKVFPLDALVIEKKASGISLIQDMRRMKRPRIPVRGFDPKKMDKIMRLELAAPMFEAGLVWYPNRQWARDVIDHIADAPNGGPPVMDLADSTSQAMLYTKNRMWAQPPDDDEPPYEQVPLSEEQEEDADGQRRSAYG